MYAIRILSERYRRSGHDGNPATRDVTLFRGTHSVEFPECDQARPAAVRQLTCVSMLTCRPPLTHHFARPPRRSAGE